MRSSSWALACFAAACGDQPASDAPPVLPGELEPPCMLGPPRHYLVTSLDVPQTAWDLDDPPDGTADPANHLHSTIALGADGLLGAALARAVSMRHVLWVVTVEECDAHARIRLRPGSDYDAATSSVGVTDDGDIASVGTVAGDEYTTARGITSSPIGAAFDSRADTGTTAWTASYNVSVDGTVGATSVVGAIGLGVEVSSAEIPISEALARTLADIAAAHPECPGTSCPEPTELILGAFDADGDGAYDAAEIRDSGDDVVAGGWLGVFGLMTTHDLLAPGPDGETHYWPSHDRIPETSGMVYTFTAEAIALR